MLNPIHQVFGNFFTIMPRPKLFQYFLLERLIKKENLRKSDYRFLLDLFFSSHTNTNFWFSMSSSFTFSTFPPYFLKEFSSSFFSHFFAAFFTDFPEEFWTTFSSDFLPPFLPASSRVNFRLCSLSTVKLFASRFLSRKVVFLAFRGQLRKKRFYQNGQKLKETRYVSIYANLPISLVMSIGEV